MKRTINTIILLCAAITMQAQNSFIVADKNGNSQLVQSLIFQRDAANDQFSWKTDADANGYQKDRDIKDLLFIARTNNTLSTGATDEVMHVLEKLSGTDNADATVVATSLLSNPNVKEAYSMNNNHVIVKMKDDNSYISCPFYNLESVFSEGEDVEVIENLANNVRQKKSKKAGEYNGKIALFNFFEGGPYHSQIRYTNLITSIFENNFYTVENYGQGYDNNGIPTFTISNLESVISRSSEYKAIIIMSHGYKTKDGVPYFATCEKYIKGKEYPTDQTVLIDNNRFVAFPSILDVDPNCLLYMGPCYGVADEGDPVYPKTSIIGWTGKNAIAQVHAAIIFHKLFYSNGLVRLGKAIDSSFEKDPFNPSSIFYKSPNVYNLTNSEYKYNESLQTEYAEGLSLTLEDCSTKDNYSGINRMPRDKFIKKTDKGTVFAINGYIKGNLSDYSSVVKVKLEPVVRIQRDGEYQLTYNNTQGASLSDNVADFEYSSCFKDIKIPFGNNTLEGIYRINVYIYDNKWKVIGQPYPMYVVYSSKLDDNYVLPEYSNEELFKPTLLDSDGHITEEITLSAGSTKTFTISGFKGHTFRTASLDSKIANVSVESDKLLVSGMSEGHTFIGVLDVQNQQMVIAEVTVTSGDDVVVYHSCPDDNHPHMIDLGLPSGTLWSCCNVGAQKPEDYGGYYAWGETVVKDDYCKDTYAFYNNGFIDIGSNISGTQYDVASVLWGNSWCMPSNKQFEELNSNCSSEYVKFGEVFGCVFKSKNNEAKVFLPAGGLFYYDRCYYQETEGSYWTSELEEDGYSFRFCFTNEGFWGVEDAYRDRGLSVRPVVSSR